MYFETSFSTTKKVMIPGAVVFDDFPEMYCRPDTEHAISFEQVFGQRALVYTWGKNYIVDGENPRPTCQLLFLEDTREYWMEAEGYLPLDFNLKDWNSITQPIKEAWASPSASYPLVRYEGSVYLKGDMASGDGPLRIVGNLDRHNHSSYEQHDRINLYNSGNKNGLIKRGEPFIIRTHVIHDINGVVEAWFNKTKVIDYQGPTLGTRKSRPIIVQTYKKVDEEDAKYYWLNLKVADYNFFLDVELPIPPIPDDPMKSGCFIATSCGSDMETLRYLHRFRDKKMPRLLIISYYVVSPSIAKFIQHHDNIKRKVKDVVLWLTCQLRKIF